MRILKLGGSILTDKARYRTIRAEDLERLGEECGKASEPLIVVHGAGSFGHVLAKEHRLHEGARSPEALRAASVVHADVRDLHASVLGSLRKGGLAPFGVPPWAISRLDSGKILHLDLSPILLAPPGTTPVTFGDVVPDRSRGVGILSGDDLVRDLGLALRAAGEKVDVVFALSADGVLDAAGNLVRTLARDAPVPVPKTGVADVTGGIVKKVEAARALAKAGARVRFVGGLRRGRVAACVRGETAPGTEIEG